MLDLIIETLAKMYDATIRGVCFAITLAVVFPVCVFLLKSTPGILKGLGLW